MRVPVKFLVPSFPRVYPFQVSDYNIDISGSVRAPPAVSPVSASLSLFPVPSARSPLATLSSFSEPHTSPCPCSNPSPRAHNPLYIYIIVRPSFMSHVPALRLPPSSSAHISLPACPSVNLSVLPASSPISTYFLPQHIPGISSPYILYILYWYRSGNSAE